MGLIELDIKDIQKEDNPNKIITFEIIIHTDEKDIDVLYLGSIDILRDYNGNLTDKIDVTFLLDQGTMFKDIEPKRDNLEATLICKRGTELETVYERKYKMLITSQLQNITAGGSTENSRVELEKYPIEVEAQLVMIEYEVIRTMMVEGTFEDSKVEDVITALMLDSVSKGEIGGESINVDFTIFKPENKHPRTIVVESGTKTLELPKYLHYGDYGVYTTGIGTYIQYFEDKPLLAVYPLYNVNRVDEEDKILELYMNTNTKENLSDDTYKMEGDILRIVAPADTQNFDTGDNEISDTGIGIVSNNPYKLSIRPTVITPVTPLHFKDETMEGKTNKEKADSINKTEYVGNEANLFPYRSDIAKRMMSFFLVLWRRGDPELIYPGMPCRFFFEDSEKGVISKRGQVQGTQTRYDHKTKNFNTFIFLAVEKTIDIKEE